MADGEYATPQKRGQGAESGCEGIVEAGMASSNCCAQGMRRSMEDAHSIVHTLPLTKYAFYGVFDGHAGSKVADHCAAALHNRVDAALAKLEDKSVDNICASLFRTVLAFDEELVNSDSDNSGSTAVFAVVTSTDVIVVGLGDARCVASVRGQCVELSVDHKATTTSEQIRITEAGGFVEAGRLFGMIAVSRAFGDKSFKTKRGPNGRFALTAEPELRVAERKDVEFLVLACDGVWDVMSSAQVVEFVRQLFADGMTDLRDIAFLLVCEALDRHTMDNVTVVIVAFDGCTLTHGVFEGPNNFLAVMERRRTIPRPPPVEYPMAPPVQHDPSAFMNVAPPPPPPAPPAPTEPFGYDYVDAVLPSALPVRRKLLADDDSAAAPAPAAGAAAPGPVGRTDSSARRVTDAASIENWSVTAEMLADMDTYAPAVAKARRRSADLVDIAGAVVPVPLNIDDEEPDTPILPSVSLNSRIALWSGVGVGDIMSLHADAIIVACNSSFAATSGLYDRVRQAGGAPTAPAGAPVEVGKAVMTTGGSLPCKHVIHAVICENDRPAIEDVRRALLSALDIAAANNFANVGIVALGAGESSLPIEVVAGTIVPALREWLQRHESCATRAIICVQGGRSGEAFERTMLRWFPPADMSHVTAELRSTVSQIAGEADHDVDMASPTAASVSAALPDAPTDSV